MTEILPPTRSQLAEFIKNHETLRRFEILFRMVGEDLPDAIANNSESALSVANNALALIASLVDEVKNDLATMEAKVNDEQRLAQDLKNLRFYIHAVNTND